MKIRKRKFAKDESGSVTVEFVLWLPLVLFLVLMAVDATFAFMGLSNMWQVSRETARVVSRYGMDEPTAETFAATQGTYGTVTPTVDVAFATGDVTVTMQMPIRAMTPFGMLGFLPTDTITTRVTHAMEPL